MEQLRYTAQWDTHMGEGVAIMTSYRILSGSVLLFLIVLIACGGTSKPSELLIGTWDAETMGEIRGVEFRSDGTVQPEGEELQRYTVIEGESDIVQIMDLNSDRVYIELELIFDGKNKCTLSSEGVTATLSRVD